MLRREGAENAAGERGVECGGRGFAAHVSYGEGDAAGTVVEVIVDVASDRACGNELSGDLSALKLRGARGHQTELDLTGHLEIALHALLFFMDTLVEAGIGDADGDLRAESRQSALVVFVVVVDAGVFKIEDANDFAFVDQRRGGVRADFRVGFDVAGVFADVGGENWLT